MFRGETSALLSLYAVGVFISFTLSQFGMFKRWMTHRGSHWVHKAFINGLGTLVTGTVVFIIAITKFTSGACIVVIIIPILVLMMLKIKSHYTAVADQLRIEPEHPDNAAIETEPYKTRVIVPI
ncbi:MAG TPA: amino acid permease, partial [Ruminiclostridium sp.]|nr:amino acid permease [Ruminiclostridium sp.]